MYFLAIRNSDHSNVTYIMENIYYFCIHKQIIWMYVIVIFFSLFTFHFSLFT